jgi:hypothetical protein
MPVILRVGAYIFFFFSNEGTHLEPPHIHARGTGGLAKISLGEPYEILESAGFSASDLRKLRRIVNEKHELLEAAYHDYFA